MANLTRMIRQMRMQTRSALIAAALLFLAFPAAPAEAQKIALFPFADLPAGPNSVDLSFTEEFRSELQRQGWMLLPQDGVSSFLDRNRVRSTGYLEPFLARKMGRELGCSHILLGAVTERREGKDPAFGLALILLDAAAGEAVWSSVASTSLSAHIALLGRTGPRTLQQIRHALMGQAIRGMPGQFNPPPGSSAPTYRVADLLVYPKFLRGKAPVNCRLKIDFLGEQPQRICLEYGSATTHCLQPDRAPGHFQGTFAAPDKNGRYPLALLLDWGDSRPPERLAGLASFEVINTAPRLEMALNRGIRIDDITVFRSHLVISPKVEGHPEVRRWAIEIKDLQGKKVLLEEHEGALPERMVWDGADAQKKRLQDGVYVMNLTVWDPAGNFGQASRKVAVQTAMTGLQLSTVEEGGLVYLSVQRQGEAPAPVVSWRLQAENQRGEAVLEEVGTSLPVTLPLDGDPGELLIVSLEARDQLGNRLHLDRQEVPLRRAEEAVDRSFAFFGWETESGDL